MATWLIPLPIEAVLGNFDLVSRNETINFYQIVLLFCAPCYRVALGSG
jgi:hypothetical protein